MKKKLTFLLIFSTIFMLNAQNPTTNTNNTKAEKKIELIPLKYAAAALAPTISEQTINYHYGKHLQTYINNLNNLIVGGVFESAELEDIVKQSDGAIFNNAAQVFNHQFYFNTFSPNPTKEPSGKLLSAIEKKWNSLDTFKKEFVTAGTSIFGSGWVWLASDKEGVLTIIKSSNAENPLKQGLTPLLCFDVWEHAYYIDYQNRRADHLNDLWKIIDWAVVQERY